MNIIIKNLVLGMKKLLSMRNKCEFNGHHESLSSWRKHFWHCSASVMLGVLEVEIIVRVPSPDDKWIQSGLTSIVASLASVASLRAIRRKGEIASLGMLTNCSSVSILRMKCQFAVCEFSGDRHTSVPFKAWFDQYLLIYWILVSYKPTRSKIKILSQAL